MHKGQPGVPGTPQTLAIRLDSVRETVAVTPPQGYWFLGGGFKTPMSKTRVDFRHEEGIWRCLTPRYQLVTMGTCEVTHSDPRPPGYYSYSMGRGPGLGVFWVLPLHGRLRSSRLG